MADLNLRSFPAFMRAVDRFFSNSPKAARMERMSLAVGSSRLPVSWRVNTRVPPASFMMCSAMRAVMRSREKRSISVTTTTEAAPEEMALRVSRNAGRSAMGRAPRTAGSEKISTRWRLCAAQ